MSYINSINNSNTDYLISGVSDIIVCGTSASTVAKTATAMDAFSLDSNLSFKIKFTNGNTASSPTLNLSNTGAKSLTTTTSNYTLVAGTVYDCYYNGTSYVLDNTVTVHTANTSNPHSVTKAQVGLGNCDNTADANKSVASAEKWTTARNISISDADGTNTGTAVSVDGSANKTLKLPSIIKATLTGTASNATNAYNGNKLNVFTCSSATGDNKAVTITGFTLTVGCVVLINFSNNNSKASATLNVNSTGAKPIRVNGEATTTNTNQLHSGVWICQYDGTYWNLTQINSLLLSKDASTDDASYKYAGLVPVKRSKFSTDGGYIVYSNGLIIQWGLGKNGSSASNYGSVSLPIAYSNTNYVILLTMNNDVNGSISGCAVYSNSTKTNDYFKFIKIIGANTEQTSLNPNYLTIGY